MLAKSYIEGGEFEADLSLHLPIPFSVLPTSLPQSYPAAVSPFSGKDLFPSGSSPTCHLQPGLCSSASTIQNLLYPKPAGFKGKWCVCSQIRAWGQS